MNQAAAIDLLERAWQLIVDEARAVLGGELHYQAVVYHCLRASGCPRTQIGMNVKQWIGEPISELFQRWDAKKHPDFRGGFEPIPDIVLFAPDIAGDWRRRNYINTLRHVTCAIEVKASERAGGRLSTGEITRDIYKLAAHRDEVVHRGGQMQTVMMVIDVAPLETERMKPASIDECELMASSKGVGFMYLSPVTERCLLRT